MNMCVHKYTNAELVLRLDLTLLDGEIKSQFQQIWYNVVFIYTIFAKGLKFSGVDKV